MKNIGYIFLGVAAIGGIYLFKKSQEENLVNNSSSNTDETNQDIQKLREKLNRTQEIAVDNTKSISSANARIDSVENKISSLSEDLANIPINEPIEPEDFPILDTFAQELADVNDKIDALEQDDLILEQYIDDEIDATKDYAGIIASNIGDAAYNASTDYADDVSSAVRDGIEVQLADNFYNKNQIDNVFISKRDAEAYTDAVADVTLEYSQDYTDLQKQSAVEESKDYTDNLNTLQNSNFILPRLDEVRAEARDYTDELEQNIEGNFVQRDNYENMLQLQQDFFATKEELSEGIQSRQPTGNYLTQGYFDDWQSDILEDQYLEKQDAEQQYFPKSVGNALGTMITGSPDFEELQDIYVDNALNIYSQNNPNFSGFRFSAW
tara:strand:+ start:280 stop:1422 length:1143 start_codon:yes stop_codon:yes gene_type:complete